MLKNYYNRSVSISLVVHDINEYDQFYWDSRSYYFAQEHYNPKTDEYKTASINFIEQKCNQLKEKYAMKMSVQPKICYRQVDSVDIKKIGTSDAPPTMFPY